ncbi:MAG TPA: hypothetical protein PKD76_01040 [Solirubrobacterales bacterium]|nr:hypothetical protein [Solirubrobacterales bacterium]
MAHPPVIIVRRKSAALTATGRPVSEVITAAKSRPIARVVENVRGLRRQNGTISALGWLAGWAVYPARRTAAWIVSTVAGPSTTIVALPIDTLADSTPSRFATTFSTVAAHAAQSIPPTRKRELFAGSASTMVSGVFSAP